MKYSKENERDFSFYFKNRKQFNFCGTLYPKYVPIYEENGVDGKQAFFSIENNGKNIPTKHPNLLSSLLLSKSSLNFNIKMWAESRADGTLPLVLFSKRKAKEVYDQEFDGPIDMEEQMSLPEWVIEAVENQKSKFYK